MAPILDALVLGFVLFGAAWISRRRGPAARSKRLRNRCQRYLNANPRSRRDFVRIIRAAVAFFTDEAHVARAVGARYGAAKVSAIVGVPIPLVFDWAEGAFGSPSSEIFLRAPAVAAISLELESVNAIDVTPFQRNIPAPGGAPVVPPVQKARP